MSHWPERSLPATPTAKELGKVFDFLVSKGQLEENGTCLKYCLFPKDFAKHFKLPLLLSNLGKAF